MRQVCEAKGVGRHVVEGLSRKGMLQQQEASERRGSRLARSFPFARLLPTHAHTPTNPPQEPDSIHAVAIHILTLLLPRQPRLPLVTATLLADE